MKCPNCDTEIPGTSCPECGTVSPEDAKYCMECGVSLEAELDDTSDEENVFDLDDRILCPDGTCTGIMVDGKCTECGKTLEEVEKSEEN